MRELVLNRHDRPRWGQAAYNDEGCADLKRSIDHSGLERRLVLATMALKAQLTNRGVTSVLIGQATAYTNHLASGRRGLQQPFEAADFGDQGGAFLASNAAIRCSSSTVSIARRFRSTTSAMD